ncbi:MAG: hypothetical protein HY904_07370 [Deltaproteobacteria bacterium]|nr:hypothetical protein [Deltaproteobacteria bacterium]
MRVHTRQEKAAAADLANRKFEVLLPIRKERRKWSDRVKTVEIAMFPGYLFVHTLLTAQRRVDMLKVHQTYDLVGRVPDDDRIAIAIPDEEIESIRVVLNAETQVDPIQRLVPGTRVRVISGALAGAVGVVEVGPDGRRRLIVQIHLLGRGVRAQLGGDDVLQDA